MALFSQDTKAASLKRSPLFEGLSKRELAGLARQSEDVEVPAGKVLCSEGDRAQEFFVIVGGEVEVTKNGRLLATRGPGDIIGEIALLANVPRTATVTAKTPLRLFVLTDQAFLGLVDANPQVERKVLRALARRVASLSDESDM
jgi:CRP-like cAMP-binding protein